MNDQPASSGQNGNDWQSGQDLNDYLPNPADVEREFLAAEDHGAAEWFAEVELPPYPDAKLVDHPDWGRRIAIPVIEGGAFVDLCLVDPDDFDNVTTACGRADWLGADNLAGDVVRLHGDIGDWLAAEGAGVLRLGNTNALHRLVDVPLIECDTLGVVLRNLPHDEMDFAGNFVVRGEPSAIQDWIDGKTGQCEDAPGPARRTPDGWLWLGRDDAPDEDLAALDARVRDRGDAGLLDRVHEAFGGERRSNGVETKINGQRTWVFRSLLGGLAVDADVGDYNDAQILAHINMSLGIAPSGPVAKRNVIDATPFTLRDPGKIPTRRWLYGKHYVRQFISTTISPGGIGKSSLTIVEALAMASGRELLGDTVHERARVWMWNGEDPREELERRVTAAAMYHGVTNDDIAGRLFVNSGRQTDIVMARQTRDGAEIAVPVVEAMVAVIQRLGIDAVVIDPFVSSHAISENDNVAMDAVIKQGWAKIADRTNCAIELVHHARKTGGNEVTVEHARGAVALIAGARAARVLNGMTEDEAAKAGVTNPYIHFRAEDGKANMAPRSKRSVWFKMENQPLGNGLLGADGDHIGVVTSWKWPSPFDGVTVADLRAVQSKIDAGEWRESIQAKAWAGVAVAEVLGLDISDPMTREKAKGLLRTWIANGALVVEKRKDENHETRSFIVVGAWATD